RGSLMKRRVTCRMRSGFGTSRFWRRSGPLRGGRGRRPGRRAARWSSESWSAHSTPRFPGRRRSSTPPRPRPPSPAVRSTRPADRVAAERPQARDDPLLLADELPPQLLDHVTRLRIDLVDLSSVVRRRSTLRPAQEQVDGLLELVSILSVRLDVEL